MAEPIPAGLRAAVEARDHGYCRMCGCFLNHYGQVHHLLFGGDRIGIGGARVHELDGLVSLCRDCHGRAHKDKARWQSLLQTVVATDGVTAIQLARWRKRRAEWTR